MNPKRTGGQVEGRNVHHMIRRLISGNVEGNNATQRKWPLHCTDESEAEQPRSNHSKMTNRTNAKEQTMACIIPLASKSERFIPAIFRK